MRCCGLPTTSTAAEPPARGAVREIASALLFREILKPLVAGLGPVGEIALGDAIDKTFVKGAR